MRKARYPTIDAVPTLVSGSRPDEAREVVSPHEPPRLFWFSGSLGMNQSLMDVFVGGAKVTRSNRSWAETITLDICILDSEHSGRGLVGV